jgi:uncharacterized protein (DUF433 family)
MVQILETDRVPLRMDQSGSIHVGNTRVLLDLVISAHNAGATPEQIVESYTTLDLADVYDVIAYYLRHRAELDEYIAQRVTEADELRKEIEANQDHSGLTHLRPAALKSHR